MRFADFVFIAAAVVFLVEAAHATNNDQFDVPAWKPLMSSSSPISNESSQHRSSNHPSSAHL